MRRVLTFTALLSLFGSPLLAQSTSPIGPETTWTLAAVGDVIMNRRITQFDHPGDPGFHRLAELIRAADAAFMNPACGGAS